MTKNKKIIYIMIPIIIVVWGVVFYQLFSYVFSSPNYMQTEPIKEVKIENIKQDTFSIIADYRDPFLGNKIKERVVVSNSQNKTKKPIPVQQKVEKPWPKVEYHGMIKNNNSNKKVGIIKINNKEYLAKVGEEYQEVKIMEMTKDMIKASFQKEIKIINK